MANDKLPSFRASDAQKKPLQRAAKSKTAQQAQEAVSAGFPTIERTLEGDILDLGGLDQRMAQLARMSEEGGAKEKGASRKALAAYERTKDLMEFLWETKGGLSNG
jgi:hypothetical protein